MAAALAAAQSDIGSESIDQPFIAAARMGTPQIYDIAESELDDSGLVRGHFERPIRGGAIK